jgi:hypothetical protein
VRLGKSVKEKKRWAAALTPEEDRRVVRLDNLGGEFVKHFCVRR